MCKLGAIPHSFEDATQPWRKALIARRLRAAVHPEESAPCRSFDSRFTAAGRGLCVLVFGLRGLASMADGVDQHAL
jgi:hypothetical protein